MAMVDRSKLVSLSVLALALALSPRAEARGNAVVSCAAPFLGIPLDDAAPTQQWSGVATSRAAAGVIAVWNENEVRVSRDDGRTFRKLNAPLESIRDVEVGAAGTVFVLDARSIKIGFSSGHVRSVPVPPTEYEDEDSFVDLVVGAGYLAHVSRDGVALTRDYGATWQTRSWPGGPDLIRFNIRADGTFDAKLTHFNCHSGDWDELYRGSINGAWQELGGDVQWFGHDLSYSSFYDDGVIRVSSLSDRGQGHVLDGTFPADEFWPAAVVHNGRDDYALFGHELYLLTGDKAHLLVQDLPEDLSVLAADGCNRVLGLLDNRLVRWSAQAGFRQLVVTSG